MIVYKYRSLSDEISGPSTPKMNTLNIIENNWFHLGKPGNFNDPYDCNIPFALSNDDLLEFLRVLRNKSRMYGVDIQEKFKLAARVTNAENKKQRTERLKKLQESFYETEFNQTGITCFSGPKQHSTILMWAHYADNHQGICLKFNAVGEFLEKLKKVCKRRSKSVTALSRSEGGRKV